MNNNIGVAMCFLLDDLAPFKQITELNLGKMHSVLLSTYYKMYSFSTECIIRHYRNSALNINDVRCPTSRRM